jgi:hypothetical protein
MEMSTPTTLTITPAPISSAAATRRVRASSARTSRMPPSTIVPAIPSSIWTRSTLVADLQHVARLGLVCRLADDHVFCIGGMLCRLMV